MLPTLLGLFATLPLSVDPAPPRPTDTPVVTAKAWAILDGKSGDFLWGSAEDTPVKAASTTKIMCAHVILNLAAKDHKVLDELVTFSKLADDTPGSTANISIGESLPVKDCLYGLLLPSGNDAGNALAEHFNSRFEPPDQAMIDALKLDTKGLATRINFIAEMNRIARKLELKNTKYRSSYGDGGTEKDRTSTARDLGFMAWNAWKDARLREVVGTRKYECQVRKPDGTTRTATWENTNKLLGKDGIDGGKTGTTNQAGNCLVSSAARGNDRLMVVVLGSKESADRFTDTQALLKWAWEKRSAR